VRTLERIHNTLVDAGFHPRYTGIRTRYYGNLECAGRRFPAWVEIPDPDLIQHPTIALETRPADIPLICAHIQTNGHICYSTAGRDVIDPYKADEHILACLRDAQAVLCKALEGDCLNDTQIEFDAYWKGTLHLVADVGTGDAGGWVKLFEVKIGDKFRFYLAADDSSAYESAGYSATLCSQSVYITSTRNAPFAFHGDWPPQTLGQLVTWLKAIDNGLLYKALRNAIQERHSEGHALTLLVRSPGAWWGVILATDKARWKTFKDSRRWANHVFKYGQDWSITRLLVSRTDPSYLIERNLGSRAGLRGRRLLLVGCGTIGGYLADLLVRAGAGVGGARSELVICDSDVLFPGNIGRHYLGLNYLYQPKADAMAKQLAMAFPYARVTGINRDARTVNLSAFDIVIDATGSEGLSLALNSRLQALERFVPSVFVWNEAGGVASQCLLVDTPKAACYRCLTDRNGHPRFSPLQNPGDDPFVSGPCDSAYVPYPAMVSMQAAALAARLILDWADGRPGKRLRTLTHDHEQGKIVRDTTPERTSQCPACSHANGNSRTADSFS
jgi:molybdopterin/thiamine biosynthesis adenylyltransferase